MAICLLEHGVSIPTSGKFSNNSKENITHLFLLCPFTCALWFGSKLTIRFDQISPTDVNEWIKSYLKDDNHEASTNL